MSVAAPAFQAEADMLAAIARVPAALAGRRRGTRNAEVMFEFFGAEGTPDIVFLEFDQAELARREALRLEPVLNFNAVAVLLALRDYERSARELAEALNLSGAHLQRAILPDLERRGWLER